MLSQQYDFVFKLLIIGNSSVGKSSLLLRYADNTFYESFLPTIGVDFKIKTIQSQNSIIKLQIWDTAGQQKFKTIISSYYKGAHGIILLFDITDRKSFIQLQNWLIQIQKYSSPNVVKLLIGNKIDKQPQRQVRSEQAQLFADMNNMVYLETSAKDNVNVQKAFIKVAQNIKDQRVKTPAGNNINININNKDKQNKTLNRKKQKKWYQSICNIF